ncbi:hypothetical protein ES707_16797 [subsurface metagenome]
MTHYFCDLSLRILLLKLKGNQVYLFNVNATTSIIRALVGRMPLIKNTLNNLAQEPDIYIGHYKGLFCRIHEEAIECSDFVCNRLELEDCEFIKVYNEKYLGPVSLNRLF